MATYISLVNLTDQGMRNVKESPARFEALDALARELGVTFRSAYYTVGNYDMVVVVEGPEEACTAMLLKIGSGGNVRTQTLRAFSVDEMKNIIGTVP